MHSKYTLKINALPISAPTPYSSIFHLVTLDLHQRQAAHQYLGKIPGFLSRKGHQIPRI